MKIKCFGIAKEIVNASEFAITPEDKISKVSQLRAHLLQNFPEFEKYKSFMIAVNESYATEDLIINPEDEIAIIPPVSGG